MLAKLQCFLICEQLTISKFLILPKAIATWGTLQTQEQRQHCKKLTLDSNSKLIAQHYVDLKFELYLIHCSNQSLVSNRVRYLTKIKKKTQLTEASMLPFCNQDEFSETEYSVMNVSFYYLSLRKLQIPKISLLIFHH